MWKPSPGDTSDAAVEASFDHGATWVAAGAVGAAAGRFLWTVPVGGPDTVRLRIVARTPPDAASDAGPDGGTERRLVETAEVRIVPSAKRPDVWAQIQKSAAWGPRDGAGGIVHDGKMWLIGGWNGARWRPATANDVWSSKDGITWVNEKPNTYLDPAKFDRTRDWEGRHFAGYASHAGKMWIVGGDPVSGFYQTDVWSSADGKKWARVDIHTTTPRTIVDTTVGSPNFGKRVLWEGWKPVEESQFGLRTFHVTGVFAGKLWLMGGQRLQTFVDPDWPGAPSKSFNDVYTSVDGATWTSVPTEGPIWEPRGIVSGVVEHRGKMWLIGGGLHDDALGGHPDREYRNDVWSTADGRHWEKQPEAAPFTARIWHDVAVFDGMLWVINGYDGRENCADAYYSPDGANWYDASPPSSFVGRHAGTSWVHDGALYVGAGNAIGKTWHADVWRLKRADAH